MSESSQNLYGPGQGLTATEINAKMQAGRTITLDAMSAAAAKALERDLNRIINAPTMMPRQGKWEQTPRWMIFKPSMRRKSWKLVGASPDSPGDMWLPVWEYQHEAFVAREALENYCAPRPTSGEGTYAQQSARIHRPQAADRVSASSIVDRV